MRPRPRHRTVKLSVLSLEPRRNSSVREERQCRRTLGLGAQVFDSRTGTARPLTAEAVSQLAETIQEYQRICTLDGGTVVAAGATQWARDAPNIAEVRARVKAETGLDFAVLSPRQEAEYGYVAASLDTPGRLVLDPGSNSFEIAWRPNGAATVASILVPYGYVRGSNEVEGSDYASGRAAYQAKARAAIEDQPAKLDPPMSLSALRAMVANGTLGREIVTLGQDGERAGAIPVWPEGAGGPSPGGSAHARAGSRAARDGPSGDDDGARPRPPAASVTIGLDPSSAHLNLKLAF